MIQTMKQKIFHITDASHADYYFDLHEPEDVDEFLDLLTTSDIGDKLKIKVVELTEEEIADLKD